MSFIEPASWICWISPLIGALLTYLSKNNTVKGVIASSSVSVSWVSSILMTPLIFSKQVLDVRSGWVSLPLGETISVGMLIDPLSIIMANIVSFVSLLILVYSIWYMRKEYRQVAKTVINAMLNSRY